MNAKDTPASTNATPASATCIFCGHDGGMHTDDDPCLVDLGPCRCPQCADMYLRGGRPLYAELCMCQGEDAL